LHFDSFFCLLYYILPAFGLSIKTAI
jgi:hypothetical protein